MLAFYDENQDPLSTLIEIFDGTIGGPSVKQVFIRNGDAAKYYTNIAVAYVSDDTDNQADGWSVKLLAGDTQPTESQWSTAVSGVAAQCADLGSVGSADTSTYLSVWVRTYCPGGTGPQRRTGHTINITAVEELV